MTYYDEHKISEFIGGHILSTIGLEAGSYIIKFVFSDGRKFIMAHDQECCETVLVEDIIGDPADLQNATVIDAREEIGNIDPEGYCPTDKHPESYTWTFYIIQTSKGVITIRWLGESNGQYSESVDILLLEPKV